MQFMLINLYLRNKYGYFLFLIFVIMFQEYLILILDFLDEYDLQNGWYVKNYSYFFFYFYI